MGKTILVRSLTVDDFMWDHAKCAQVYGYHIVMLFLTLLSTDRCIKSELFQGFSTFT